MTSVQIITRTMEQFSENELIFSSKLYAEQLSEAVSEESYYQTLGRMCKTGTLCRIAKGTYYRPKTSKYGIVPPSQNEIIAALTEHDRGVVVGYSLYNRLKLTTQIPQKVEVFSSQIEQQDHYGVKNSLSKHLSALSEYRHPTIEEIIRKAHAKG